MKPFPENFAELQGRVHQQMSLLLESRGYSPLVGKILSLLLFASGPLSLKEIADRLEVSKAAVSVQVRAMERHGMCHKVPYRNDRRDYYAVADDLCVTIIRSELAKVQEIQTCLHETLSALTAFSELGPDEEDSYIIFKNRFTELSSLYGLFAQRLKTLAVDWSMEHS
ncbi:GbsR/MarR family transcriptional regulator [Paenibacillus xerothermodurans]|uniref:MarR family transcriptional regulator n=1 Tax=Paenibacillus xerothermodurans TaxID=1977292 RepID=A0A2W1NUS2_PAEXE|nr:MarR family transcriptional regulator [Paenibacillus xerothermodurans]PZE21506.1 MarR family transcriptional regulator [Paenibacillus xerothermodurans]